VSYLHELEYVHKLIRSDNILLTFEKQDNENFETGYLGHVNLKGFGLARKGTGDAQTRKNKDSSNWKTQFYCHPQRQVVEEQKAHDKAVQAGKTGPQIANDADAGAEPKLEYFKYKHDIYSVGVVLLEIGLWQDLAGNHKQGLHEADAELRKRTLVGLTEHKLPQCMGKKYAGIVGACLDVDRQGDQFRVKDVLKRLDEIHF
jgi:serine/threonine protein kinase